MGPLSSCTRSLSPLSSISSGPSVLERAPALQRLFRDGFSVSGLDALCDLSGYSLPGLSALSTGSSPTRRGTSRGYASGSSPSLVIRAISSGKLPRAGVLLLGLFFPDACWTTLLGLSFSDELAADRGTMQKFVGVVVVVVVIRRLLDVGLSMAANAVNAGTVSWGLSRRANLTRG